MLKKIEQALNTLLSSRKEKILSLATTANQRNPIVHLCSPRETEREYVISLIFKEFSLLAPVIEMVDGRVDVIFLDCETKCSAGSLADHFRSRVLRTPVWEYKPNDYTVAALDSFLAHLLNTMSGKKIGIWGVGNIGGKIALCLAERGAKVYCFRRDVARGKKIVAGLNALLKGPGRIVFSPFSQRIESELDLVLGCTPGIPVIEEDTISRLPGHVKIVDVGNGTIASNAIALAARRGLGIFCHVPHPGFEGVLAMWRAYRSLLPKLGRRQLANGGILITPGLLGERGAILVDDLERIHQIYGVCDGQGDLLTPTEAEPFLKKVKRTGKK